LEIKYRKVNADDLLLVFNWANEPTVRNNSYHSQFISLEEHTNWFKQKLQEKNSLIYIAEIDNEPAGMVRFEIAEEHAIVSIIVDQNFRGMSLASVFLEDCSKYYFDKNSKPILACIKSDNLASIHAFRKANYSFLREEIINNIKSQIFKRENA